MHIGLRPIAAFRQLRRRSANARIGREGGAGVASPDRAPYRRFNGNGAYDRKSSIGHLDKALDAAQAEGLGPLSDMKNDWKNHIPVREQVKVLSMGIASSKLHGELSPEL